ncbi:hypothetical protein J6590_010046 [Homalodisca vitripennis]|nr:hypothetical protein J6590_010046 [Homalodisca vitripennis]
MPGCLEGRWSLYGMTVQAPWPRRPSSRRLFPGLRGSRSGRRSQSVGERRRRRAGGLTSVVVRERHTIGTDRQTSDGVGERGSGSQTQNSSATQDQTARLTFRLVSSLLRSRQLNLASVSIVHG